jgi:hypothetical protein
MSYKIYNFKVVLLTIHHRCEITINLNSLYNDIYFIIFKGESASSKKKVDTFGQNDADWDVYKEIVRIITVYN